MPASADGGYEFGPYRIDAGERLLRREGEPVPLPPKVASTLIVLVENAGRMVDKNDLMKAVWPDTFVEEGALARNISLLRKTFGDTGEAPAYIETIPKRGYRFVAPVRGAGAGEPATPPRPAPRKRLWLVAGVALAVLAVAAAAARYAVSARKSTAAVPASSARTLAVIPFRSIDRSQTQEYFADGMTQALISSMSALRKFRVIYLAAEPGGQRDAAAWNAILRDHSVQYVLSGSILRSGGRVRIDAQLIDPRTKTVHWANSYARGAEDVLALESTVAEAIAGEVQVTVTPEERLRLRHRVPANSQALEVYLQGRYFWNRRTEEALRRAIQYFEQAIAADPEYALAYSGLADSYSLLGSVGTDGMAPNEAMPRAKAAARKALDLDPELADAHVSLAYVHLSYDWDLSAAEREFSRALALNPNSATGRHWYSHYFMAAGDLRRAGEQMREALQLEPLSPSINIGTGWCLYYARQYDAAIERFRSVAEMDPTLPLAHQTLGMAYEQKGRLDQAVEEYKRAAAFSGNSPASVAALASAFAASGKRAEAAAELARLEELSRTRYVPALYFASVHYAMGDLARAFEWGWKAIGERCDYLMYLRVEPRAGKLAGHPEFLRAMASLHRR